MRILFPGTELALESGAIVTVYPLGVRHLRKFTEELSLLLGMLNSGHVRGSEAEIGVKVMSEFGPVILSRLINVINECCVIQYKDEKDLSLDDLPHWELPVIAQQWIEDSFGSEGKRKPWITAIETLMSRVLKKKTTISEMLSRSVSSPVTP